MNDGVLHLATDNVTLALSQQVERVDGHCSDGRHDGHCGGHGGHCGHCGGHGGHGKRHDGHGRRPETQRTPYRDGSNGIDIKVLRHHTLSE